MIQKIKVGIVLLGATAITYFFVFDSSALESLGATRNVPEATSIKDNTHSATPIIVEKSPVQEETIKLFVKANSAFSKMDTNKNQYLEPKEWDNTKPFETVDISKDHKISFEEYAQAIAGAPVAQRTTHTAH